MADLESAGVGDLIRLKVPVRAAIETLRKSRFELQSDESPRRRFPPDMALALGLQRQDFPSGGLRVGGHPIRVVPFPVGAMSLVNLARDPTPYRQSKFDCLNFFLRRDTFDQLADDHGAARIADLRITPGIASDDPIVAHLGSCLLPAIEGTAEVNASFLDHVAKALHVHLAQRYGGMRMPRTSVRGGLTPWQLRVARDSINANLSRAISLPRMASACGLSVSHFATAFRHSTGVTPHRWLMARRVDRAKDLMRLTEACLAAIALQCGFSEQSHFTRVFSQTTGTTPAQWRQESKTRQMVIGRSVPSVPNRKSNDC
jgi:AraC family transcriptional regulator